MRAAAPGPMAPFFLPTPQGYLLPVFSDPDRCNACGICEWMCPHFAIEVYKLVESEAAKTG